MLFSIAEIFTYTYIYIIVKKWFPYSLKGIGFGVQKRGEKVQRYVFHYCPMPSHH